MIFFTFNHHNLISISYSHLTNHCIYTNKIQLLLSHIKPAHHLVSHINTSQNFSPLDSAIKRSEARGVWIVGGSVHPAAELPNEARNAHPHSRPYRLLQNSPWRPNWLHCEWLISISHREDFCLIKKFFIFL